MDNRVMPEGFSPRKRGRKPSFDIEPLLHEVTETKEQFGQERWTAFQMSKEDAASARRQLARMPFEVSVDNKAGEDSALLFVRAL